ncbi:acetyltransferase [Marinobacter sp. MA]|uniref:acetyltransferase n=1 Tax=Marinobacter sp. MA TaxID=2971606 RepID=UPI003AB0099B
MISKSGDLRGKTCVLMGAGGHAKVVTDLALALGANIEGVCDPFLARDGKEEWQGLKVLGDDDFLLSVSPEDVLLLNGVGQMPGSTTRSDLFERFSEAGFLFVSLVHPSAWVSPTATLNDGVQIMAGAIVQAGAFVGSNTIINTLSSVDHDSRIGASVHIAPGVTVCGDAIIGDDTFVGAGATIIQGINVRANSFVKAGSLVCKDMV